MLADLPSTFWANLATTWPIQALGVGAFLVSLFGYLSLSDHRMKVMMTVGTALFALQFVFLGSWLVAVSLLINTSRTWLSIYHRGFRLFVVVALIQTIVGLSLAKQIYDFFPIAGSIIGSYGLLCLSGPKLRIAMLLTTTLWFINLSTKIAPIAQAALML